MPRIHPLTILDLPHRPLARGERLPAVRCGHRDRHGRAADGNPAEPVDDRHLEGSEFPFGAFRDLGHLLEGHGPVHLVVEGPDARVRTHSPYEQDDGPSIVTMDRVHNGFEIDRRSLDSNHRRPPLTGGIRATSSPSRRDLEESVNSQFTARSIEDR